MTQSGAAPSSSEMAEKQWKYNLDPDILECPICSVPFFPPVYQCENGHTLCSACREKLIAKECPSCSQPIRRIRNIAVEKIIESLQVEWKHRGCNKMVKYTERKEHENELCEYLRPSPVQHLVKRSSAFGSTSMAVWLVFWFHLAAVETCLVLAGHCPNFVLVFPAITEAEYRKFERRNDALFLSSL